MPCCLKTMPIIGWGIKQAGVYRENGHALGWVVGWIEENQHPYFFVLNIESPDHNFDMKQSE